MKNYLLKTVTFSLFFVIYTLPLLADDDGPGGDPYAGDDPHAPIDNWLLPLAVAGIVVAVYFILKQKRKAIV